MGASLREFESEHIQNLCDEFDDQRFEDLHGLVAWGQDFIRLAVNEMAHKMRELSRDESEGPTCKRLSSRPSWLVLLRTPAKTRLVQKVVLANSTSHSLSLLQSKKDLLRPQSGF
jgi:hypothetical protein